MLTSVIVVAGRARLRNGKREQAVAAATRMIEATRSEPGCRQYRYGFAVDDPDELMVFELWEDQGALDAHFQTSHMAEFTAALVDLIVGDVDVTRYEIAASGPLTG